MGTVSVQNRIAAKRDGRQKEMEEQMQSCKLSSKQQRQEETSTSGRLAGIHEEKGGSG